MSVAILHFRLIPDDGQTEEEILDRARRIVDLLAAADVLGVSLTGLLSGAIQVLDEKPGVPGVLFLVEADGLSQLAAWADICGPLGYTSLAPILAGDIGKPGYPGPQDLSMLLGHGVVMGAAGMSDGPLLGLSTAELRADLQDAHDQLQAACGYRVSALCPRPNRLALSIDGLILREAHRAGFQLVFIPGEGIYEPEELKDGAGVPLTYRQVEPDDTPNELRRWVIGKGLARERARLRRYSRVPRRLLRLVLTPNADISR
ncbi:MAG: hypothetical protein ACNA8W_03560 [Bradymonadaceae bacterium]